jgi:hypothetical protein
MSLISNDPGAPAGGGQPPAGAPNPAPAGGNPTPFDFKTLLPEDIRGDKAWESFKPKDQNEFTQLLAKGYHGQLSVIGKKGLIVPDDKATPEQRAEFYKALGRPEKPDDYGTPLPEGLTADKLNTQKISEWKKELHDQGIPKAAAEKLIGKYLSDQHAQAKEQEAEIAGWEQQVRQEFGQDFDKNLNFAKFAIKEFGSEELVAALDKTGFGSHPEMLKMLAKMGQKMGDHQAAGGGNNQQSFGGRLTPENAQIAIQEFERDQKKMTALRTKNDPDHDRMVKEHTELYLQAFPPAAKS